MVNINKIKELSKEQGLSLSFICGKIGVARVYFNDIQNSGRDIPDDRLSTIADLLNTTVAYLRDETDKKEKPLGSTEELSDLEREIMERLNALSPEKLQEAEAYIDYLLSQQEKENH